MQKICFVIASMGSGGAEHQLMEVANGLVDRGYEIEIVTFADIPDHYQLDKRVIRKRILPSRSNLSKLLYLWKYIIINKYSNIFCFGQRESIIALFAMIISRKKFYVGERNTNIGKLPFLSKFKLWLLYKVADYIVPNSHSQAKFISKNFFFANPKINVITNYTNINLYKEKYSENGDTVRICVFARYSNQKNYRRFAEVLREVKENCQIQFHVDWFGNKKFKNSGLDPNYIEFSTLIKKYQISEIITLNDSISNVSNKMREYDAFCLPSLYEGFSNSISEAISCGLPALVSDVSDNYLMVKDGFNGFLFNPLDINSMKHTIIKFLNLSYEERVQMSKRSRQIAESLFDKDAFIDKYVNILNK